MRRKAFFHAGQRIGVAVSGGPDSVLLLYFMEMLADESGLTLAAVHFNHRLRGAESDGDEALVRGLAQAMHIDYLRSEAEVGRLARTSRCNLEAVARELRYKYFFSLVEQGGLDWVATAHTANDQAETVLMRLLRGAGTRGLGGIYPVLDQKVVRPFLGVTRAEVMQEIASRELAYRIDSTNLDVRLRRNKVRIELLPLLAKEYNPEIVSVLSQLADCSREDEVSLEALARERAQPWPMQERGEERIPVATLRDLPPALARRVLRQMLQSVRGASSSVSYDHIEALRRLAAGAHSGRVLTLPGGTVARREFAWLVVGRLDASPSPEDFSYSMSLPGELTVPELGCTYRLKILTPGGPAEAYNLNKVVGLDARKLAGEVVLRNWRAGDCFRPLGSRGTRKLKELFRERKIPQARRKNWPVMLCGGQIVWVRGFPPAQNAAATRQTQRVLIVEEEPMRPVSVAQERSL